MKQPCKFEVTSLVTSPLAGEGGDGHRREALAGASQARGPKGTWSPPLPSPVTGKENA
jgi:hypothetical protein